MNLKPKNEKGGFDRIDKMTVWVQCDKANRRSFKWSRFACLSSGHLHPERFLIFPLRVCQIKIMVSNHNYHVFQFLTTEIKMSPDGLIDSFWFLW